ncbi:ERG2 and sigma1 receptor-like protein [Mycena kentingensis (nom. inval.)]|nr:ERG2 and sigma1 receptor-like protein [Mycena kentingensis (nom. inval.)]
MAQSKKNKPTASARPQQQDVLTKWATRVAVVCLLVALGRWLDSIKSRWYVFDPTLLHELAQDAIAAAPHPNDTSSMIQHIVANLTQTYPSSQIKLNVDSSEWMFNNAGGAMGAMYIIHASITEYLIIFGTPLGTEGHRQVLLDASLDALTDSGSGLHTADDYFHILTGEQWAFRPGALEMERYTPGMQHFLPRGNAKQYKMHKGCFALEYARGWIPLMLPFGFADTFTSTLDIFTLWDTVWITGREMLRNLAILKI